MLATAKSLTSIFVAIALLMAGLGLQTSLLGIRGGLEGFSEAWLGIITSGYFIGFLFASMRAPALIRAVGHIRVFAAFASLASVVILIHTMWPEPIVWFILRLVTGFSMACLYVVIESWINQASTNETRGQMLSVYMVIVFGFMTIGQVPFIVLPETIINPSAATLFMVVSIVVSISLVPVSLTRAPAPTVEDPEPLGLAEMYRYTPFGFVACFVNGLAQACVFGLAPVFGVSIGLDIQYVALMAAAPFLFGGFLQYPLGALSDRIDRRLVTSLAAILSAATAAGIAIVLADISEVGIVIGMGLFGGLSSVIYSLIIAHVNDVMPQQKMVAASAMIVMIFGTGSAIGPTLVGFLMDFYGPAMFMWFGCVTYGFIAVYGLYRVSRRSIDLDDRGDYVFLASRATSIAAAPILEEAGSEEDIPAVQ